MTDQTDTSAGGTSGEPNLELLYTLAPLYWRLLTAGVAQLSVEYEGKEGMGEVCCQACNTFGQNVTSKLNDEFTKGVVAFVLVLLEIRHPNWTRDAGAHGRIDWNLTRNELHQEHHQRTITVTTTKHRGL